MDTTIVFADGKDLIVHHECQFTNEELIRLKQLTSKEFTDMLMKTGRYKKIDMKDNPFLRKG